MPHSQRRKLTHIHQHTRRGLLAAVAAAAASATFSPLKACGLIGNVFSEWLNSIKRITTRRTHKHAISAAWSNVCPLCGMPGNRASIHTAHTTWGNKYWLYAKVTSAKRTARYFLSLIGLCGIPPQINSSTAAAASTESVTHDSGWLTKDERTAKPGGHTHT